MPAEVSPILAVSGQILHTKPPAQTLDAAYVYCDPSRPLDPGEDDNLRIDFSELRGGDRLGRIARGIRRAGSQPTLHLLTGHMGSGKTTELRRMCQQLRDLPGEQTLVVWLDAERLLALRDIGLEDVLLGLWLQLGKDSKPAMALLTTWWKTRIKAGLTQLSADLPDALIDGLGKLLGDARNASTDARSRWREQVAPLTSSLIEGLNLALAKVREGGTGRVVIAVDQLEKLGIDDATAVERLYVDRLQSLRQLDAHVILTVPLYLCYSVGGAGLVSRAFGAEPVVLPMVKVSKRRADGGGLFGDGIAAMRAMLERRVDFAQLFEKGPTAAERIAELSGGCVFQALAIVQSATEFHETAPVALRSVELAAGSLIASYERALPEAWVPHVVHVHREQAFSAQCPPDVKRDLLRLLYVLEYQNGEPAPWHDVHPLVLQTPKVQRALLAPTS